MEKFWLNVGYVRMRSLRLVVKLILESIWISLRGAWPEVGEEQETPLDEEEHAAEP